MSLFRAADLAIRGIRDMSDAGGADVPVPAIPAAAHQPWMITVPGAAATHPSLRSQIW